MSSLHRWPYLSGPVSEAVLKCSPSAANSVHSSREPTSSHAPSVTQDSCDSEPSRACAGASRSSVTARPAGPSVSSKPCLARYQNGSGFSKSAPRARVREDARRRCHHAPAVLDAARHNKPGSVAHGAALAGLAGATAQMALAGLADRTDAERLLRMAIAEQEQTQVVAYNAPEIGSEYSRLVLAILLGRTPETLASLPRATTIRSRWNSCFKATTASELAPSSSRRNRPRVTIRISRSSPCR